jgi:hypothetical protein
MAVNNNFVKRMTCLTECQTALNLITNKKDKEKRSIQCHTNDNIKWIVPAHMNAF